MKMQVVISAIFNFEIIAKERNMDSIIYDIPMAHVRATEINVRHTDKDKDIDQLANSIKSLGLLQPIVLLGEHGKPNYQVMVGQRRYLAHKRLGKSTIKAIFENEKDKTRAILMSLVENMLRVDLNHADAAEAVTLLYKKYGKNDAAERRVAKDTGMSLQRVREYIMVEERATPEIKKKLREKKIKLGDVKRAMSASHGNMEKAERILDLMADFSLTGHEKKRLVEYGEENKDASADKIIKEAKKPRVEQTLLVSLSEELQAGLKRATEELSLEREEVAIKAIGEWLRSQGFSK